MLLGFLFLIRDILRESLRKLFTFSSSYFDPYVVIPPEEKPSVTLGSSFLHNHSAVEVARMIKSREKSVTEIVEESLHRIKAINKYLNAVVSFCDEQALSEAKRCDEYLSSGGKVDTLPEFYGVPITIKECFAVEGFPNTAGQLKRAEYRNTSSDEAQVVKKLKEAGFIIVGLTNTSELCMWYECHNRLYGRTNNPYDLRRHPGGSSGGEGSIIGGGGSLVGLGSDIGGSIRMPAFFCGVFGHKATGGFISNHGQHPTPTSEFVDPYCTPGPLARRSEDLYPLLRIMAKRPQDFKDPASVDVQKLKVYSIVEGNGILTEDVHPSLKEGQKKALEFLQTICKSGEIIEAPPQFKRAFIIWSHLVGRPEETKFTTHLSKEEEGWSVYQQLLRWFWSHKKSAHTFPGLMLSFFEHIAPPPKVAESTEILEQLRQTLDNLLGDDGVLLYPTHPTFALKHGAALAGPSNMAYTGLFNVLEYPSTAVPLGLTKVDDSVLPLGCQVIAKRGNDHLTLAVAQQLEKKFGGWQHSPVL